jgi:hypothetical protein
MTKIAIKVIDEEVMLKFKTKILDQIYWIRKAIFWRDVYLWRNAPNHREEYKQFSYVYVEGNYAAY